MLSLKIVAGKDIEHEAIDGSAGAPSLRRMPLFLMPREKTDRKRISHKIAGCGFVKSAALLEESDALKFQINSEDGPRAPLLPPPPMVMWPPKKEGKLEPKETEVPDMSGGDAAPVTVEDPPDGEAEDTPAELPEPQNVEFEEGWVQLDPHEDVGGGKPLKEGKTTAKPPPRLLRPLAETALSDPFGDSDLYEVAPLKGILRRLGLEDLQDCEFLVAAEMRRQRRQKAEERRIAAAAAGKDPDLPDDYGDEDDGVEPEDPSQEDVCPATPPRSPRHAGGAAGTALGVAYTPSTATAEQISDFRKKIEDAQRSYDEVVRQRLNELQLFEGVSGGLATVYANVRKWQDGLEPFLAEQEAREAFDIHQYGSYILDRIRENKDEKLEFFRLVEGLPTWQVYRYFLSALVLTNNGNLDVFSKEEKFVLGLLDADKAYTLEDQEDLLNDKEAAKPALAAPEDDERAAKRAKKGAKKAPDEVDAVEAKVRAHKKGRKDASAEVEEEAPAEVDPAPAKRRRRGE